MNLDAAIIQSIGKLTYFRLWEAQCKCGCGLVILAKELLFELRRTRFLFAKPIVATSWTRCLIWNRLKGGKDDSYHRNGRGIDIRPTKPYTDMDMDDLERIARMCFAYVKRYEGHLHCDIRGERPWYGSISI